MLVKKKAITILGWFFLVAVLFLAYWFLKNQNTVSVPQGTPVGVHFLQLKDDADCVLIQQGEANIVIDTGEKQDAEKVVSYLKEKNVKSIEYLILTHPDKDHIGGAIDILDNFKVKNIIQPYYIKENEQLQKVNQTAKTDSVRIIYPTITKKLSLGGMEILIYPPLEKNYEKDNNYSLVTLVKHGKVNMLFAGDAEKKRLSELMLVDWNQMQLVKTPHHGRANINSEAFIKALKPTYAVITSNDADEIIKQTYHDLNTQVFYTSSGDKSFYSDGTILTVNDKT